MTGSAARYVETAEHFTVRYVRCSRVTGVLWGVFTLCYAIISVAVFVQPQWIGDTAESPGSGYFGLWRHCAHTSSLQGDPALTCSGRLSDLSTAVAPEFRAATVLVGLAVVLALLTVTCCLMFCFLQPQGVFTLCGWMQLLSGCCMLVGVLVFPAGWDAARLREVCGPMADRYRPGGCGVRWALALAVIGAFDALVLAALALALGRHRVHATPEPELAASVSQQQLVGPRDRAFYSGAGMGSLRGPLAGQPRGPLGGSLGGPLYGPLGGPLGGPIYGPPYGPLGGEPLFRSGSAGSLADSRRSLSLNLQPVMLLPSDMGSVQSGLHWAGPPPSAFSHGRDFQL